MKKVVGMLVAVTLLVSPAMASAANSFHGDFLIAKKGGNSSGNSGDSNSGNSGSNSDSSDNGTSSNVDKGNTVKTEKENDKDSSKTTSEATQSDSIDETDTNKGKKNTKEDINLEKTRLLEEYKNNKTELKNKALELRQQLEATVEAGEEKAELLETTAELLEEAGELDEAIATQEEAVQEDLTNVDRYKKLAKLMEKNGNKEIKAFVNGKHPVFDVPPVIKSGRTLVPIRAISESLGAEVTWDQETQTATIVKDGVEIKLVLNEVKAYVDGKEIELDVPSTSINSRIVIPLRFISEAFNAAVQWEDETDSVIIVDDEEIAEGTTEESTENESATEETSEDSAGETATDETIVEETDSADAPANEPADETGTDDTATENTVPTENTTEATI